MTPVDTLGGCRYALKCMKYESWGRYPKVTQEAAIFCGRNDPLPFSGSKSVLPYGLGRSYGDSCLNDNGIIVDTSRADRFIAFDETSGIVRCEAGVSLEDILDIFVPRGYFLSVSPGTKFVTVGGAIANDIHGKNHHASGTFGAHVPQFELLRSNGERLLCSPSNNSELYAATIGGLGLTGLITWADIQLKPVRSGFLDTCTVKFRNLTEFFEVSSENESKYEYSVSWVDCTTRGAGLGRGLYMGGNFSDRDLRNLPSPPAKKNVTFPIEAPGWLLNPLSMKSFNILYYEKQRGRVKTGTTYYEPFFYPLDAINKWNRMYGKRGFFQYQLVVPYAGDYKPIETIFDLITKSGRASFLAVLKTFGSTKSPGLMSFPRQGVTLALDFPNDGQPTLDLMNRLDEVVRSSKGCVYPAKDARMSAESFRHYFPQYRDFSTFIDPKFSSSFWRRVTAGD